MSTNTILMLLGINVAIYLIGRLFGFNSGYIDGYVKGVKATNYTYKRFFASLGTEKRKKLTEDLNEFMVQFFKEKT